MVCRACGRTIANEDANFCEYCGTATNVNRDGSMEYGSANSTYRQTADRTEERMYGGDSQTSTYGTNKAENSVGFLHWLVIMLLPFLPVIGMFAYLAVLIIWAFGHTASTTRKNWARATLLVIAISFFMIMYMFQSVLGGEGMAELMNSMVGTGGIS